MTDGTDPDPSSGLFIYGSCVSRDAFEFPGAPKIANYIARSSLASAFAPPPSELPAFDLEANPSAFQRRMVTADIEKQLPHLLRAHDVGDLILDLIDERFALRRIGGSVVTQSPELGPCLPPPKREDLLVSGSPEHKHRFAKGLEQLLLAIPPERVILNRVHWSHADETGEQFANPTATNAANALLDEFYELARTRGITRELTYSPDLMVASASHKWGRSPFHYINPFYASMLSQLASLGHA
jgi:hypothetical protein